MKRTQLNIEIGEDLLKSLKLYAIKKNVKFLINNLDQKSRIEITRLNKNVIIKS